MKLNDTWSKYFAPSNDEASETIIPSLIEMGFQLVTVEELAESRGGMEAGKVYYSFRP